MKPNIPLSLKIVAYLFIISGVFAAIEILVSLTQNHINLNFGVLGIFVGIGLLKLKDTWRVVGLVLIWIGLILTPIFLCILLSVSGPVDFNLFGQKVSEVGKIFVFLPITIFYALLLWERSVLSRPDIRALFQN